METKILKGDITEMSVDVIVNAANRFLLAGSGVCGAIFKASRDRESLRKACEDIGCCPPGEAVITRSYGLKAPFIIHAVGPVYRSDDDAVTLENAYINSLKLADEKGFKSIAFPALSTGIYGYPLRKATKIALKAVIGFPAVNLSECFLCCFDEHVYSVYREEYALIKEKR